MGTFSFILRLSGFIGLSVGFVVELYAALLRDPVLYGGAQSVPGWVGSIASVLLFGSLAVLFYGSVLDDIFKGWVDLVTLCAVGGQWGVPLGIYLTVITSAGSLAGLLIVVGYGLDVLAAIVVTITYLRRRGGTRG
jgi:hypothetical protein